MDTQIEEGCVESTNNYLIDEEEDLLKLKNKILDFFEAKMFLILILILMNTLGKP
jgi:hypothetical protein